MPEDNGALRSISELPLDRLLWAAEIIYKARGYLPLYISTELMTRGCIVHELENLWDRTGIWQ